MKTLLTSILGMVTLLMLLAACHKQREEENAYCTKPALILGPDYRKCVCCGGWFISLQDDTVRAYLPSSFVSTFSLEDLPLPVFLETADVEKPCLGDEIDVLCVRSRSN